MLSLKGNDINEVDKKDKQTSEVRFGNRTIEERIVKEERRQVNTPKLFKIVSTPKKSLRNEHSGIVQKNSQRWKQNFREKERIVSVRNFIGGKNVKDWGFEENQQKFESSRNPEFEAPYTDPCTPPPFKPVLAAADVTFHDNNATQQTFKW